uniref:ANK_REP_REGION domain-containing protein n=3 Tax=Wuchereria bancrofti TaxID=6293 RepID=A0AAF5Q0Q7_WUCBA
MMLDGLGETQQTQQFPLYDLELSDDGSSLLISEPEKRQVSCPGRRRTSGIRQRQGSSASSTQVPPSVASNGLQRAHSSPLPAYPVSIRQQLAIIKQMEQPMQVAVDSSSPSLQLPQTSTGSPGLSRRRISRVHKKNERGETPLHVAARKGEHQLCKKLIEEGAVINARDYAGWTPLHEACYHGHFKVAKLLLGYDADVNALSDCDDTPLHDAVTSGNEKLVWLLLHAGASRDRVDNDGKKPIDICHSEYSGIRNLLSAATIPELCPVDESPSLSQSSSSHIQGSSQVFTANLIQLTAEKQCLISPNSDDSEANAETFPRERDGEISEELGMQLQGSRSQLLSGGDFDKSTKSPDFDDVVLRDEEVKAGIHHDFGDIDHSLSMHRSLWPEERNDALKRIGLHTGSSPYEFDHDLSPSFENTCFGINESKEAEIRNLGLARGTYTERFSPQYTSQKSTHNEKRKQRGRRRGRDISVAACATIMAQASQSDDVYEFRSSPESEVGVNKTESVGDMERELSESPNLKRQRFNQTETTTVASFTSTAMSETSTTQEGISILEKGEALDIVSNVSDLTDEKADGTTIGRKVPPLRISLPRTPTEDGAAIASSADDVTSVAMSAIRRNTRSTKSITRRNQSPEQSVSNTCDESIQRVTRSKLRQSGRQLRDHPSVSYETSAKRKSNSWRRNSTVIGLPMPVLSAATSDEQTSSNDAGDRADADENSHLELAALKEDENTLLALSLMKKNSYEGFRDFRCVIEERWAKDATEEIIAPESPPNFKSYLIVQGNYTSASNLDLLSSQEKVDLAFMEKLTIKLRNLHTEQQEKRRNMYFYHQVERERLQMQAENEVIRMLMRKANGHNGSFSTMRVIRETNLFNTGFLEVKPKKLPIMEISEVKVKYEKLAEIMRRRQQMEADALYAEQIFIWNAAVQRSEDVTLSSLKNAIPHVSVNPVILNF